MGYYDANRGKGVGTSVQHGLMTMLIGLSLVAVSVACATAMIFLRRKQPVHTPRVVEKRRDDVLKETFPASDAPASQYFDIPVNRL